MPQHIGHYSQIARLAGVAAAAPAARQAIVRNAANDGWELLTISPDGHTHTISQITGLQAALDAAATTADMATLGGALGDHLTDGANPHGTTAAQVGAYTTAQVDTALAGKADVGHTHPISSVTGLQTALDAKAATGDLTQLIDTLDGHRHSTDNPHATTAAQVGAYTIGQVNAALSGKADSLSLSAHTGNTDNPHGVTAAQVGAYTTGQVEALLTDKADTEHGHAIADVAGLQGALDGKASSSHSHALSDLTMATARLLGRTTAGSGSPEEISVGSGLSLAAGVLAATGTPGGGITTVYKSANESVIGTTFSQADDDLTVAVEANTLYRFWGWLFYTGDPTADIDTHWDFPAGSTLAWVHHLANEGAGKVATSPLVVTDRMPLQTNHAPNTRIAYFFGTLDVGATAGNLTLHWAQDSSNATPTVLQRGSSLTIEPLS